MGASLSAWMRHRQKAAVVGVDLADEQVHLLELGGGQEVRAAVSAELPAAEGFNAAITAAVIREAFKRGGLRAHRAALALPAAMLQIRRLQLPPGLDEDSLQELLRADAERYLPCPAAECCFDFECLPAASSAYTELRLYACARRQLEPRCEALRLAGLEVIAADLESYALEAGLRACLPPPGDGALLYLRRRRCDLLLLDAGETSLMQELPGYRLWLDEPSAYTRLLSQLRAALAGSPQADLPLLLGGAGPMLDSLATRLAQDLQRRCTPARLPAGAHSAALLAYGLAARAQLRRV